MGIVQLSLQKSLYQPVCTIKEKGNGMMRVGMPGLGLQGGWEQEAQG